MFIFADVFSSHAECGPLRRLDFVMGPVGVRGMYRTFFGKGVYQTLCSRPSRISQILTGKQEHRNDRRSRICHISVRTRVYAREGPCRALPLCHIGVGSALLVLFPGGNARACDGGTSKIQTPRLFLSVTNPKHSAPQGVGTHATHTAMKQLLFFVTALILAVLPVKAQTSQVATLSHEGTITTFYSANALKDAYAAAVDGDVITLSSGTFTSTEIKKNITVRGAGMMLDENPTIISGSVVFNLPQSTEGHTLTMEGILFTHYCSSLKMYAPSFIKCQFSYEGANTSFSEVENAKYIHCIFKRFGDSYLKNSSGTFQNCVFDSFYSSTSSNNFNINNCIIGKVGLSTSYGFKMALTGCSLTNTFFTCDDNRYVCFDNVCINCVYAGGHGFPFGGNSINCKRVAEDVEPFENRYHLKAEYASEWIGNDGSEIGVYGGSMPFDPATTNPQISKFNVASKTTADGKLSVDIEVKAN